METTDGLPLPQRNWAILTIMLGLTMAVLDGAIANVALPTIARDVRASPADSIWVVNAYQLAVTISLLPLSSIGEIHGYRRVYRAGLALFTVASLGCALSHSLATLTIARVVQGFGAAGIMSVNTALVRFIYPRARLGQAMGLNAMVGSAASALGPTVAAGILSVATWPYLFAVNVPIGLLTFAIAMRSLPLTERAARRFDTTSAALSAVTFGLLITGIDGAGHGERIALVAAVLIGAVAAGGILVRRQLAITSPLLPIDLMRIPMFGLSVATSICAFAAQGLAIVSLPFFFENTLHRGQVATGLLLTPWPLTVAVVAPLAGRLSDRFPAGLLGGIGLLVLAAGLLGLVLLPPDPSAFDIAWRMALCGAGFGFFNSPNNRAMIAAAPRSRTGGASGMLSTARLLGQTTGAALVALTFGLAPTHGTGLALSLATALALAAAAVSLSRLGGHVRPARVMGSD